MTDLELHIVYMPLDEVLPADRNAKLHDEAGIDASIERFGFADTPVLDERTSKLIGGHGRIERTIARRDAGKPAPKFITVTDDGVWLVPIQRGWASENEAEADAAALALNFIGEKGGTNPGILAAILADVSNAGSDLLAATGYNADHLTDLVAMLAGPPTLEEAAKKTGDPHPRDFWPILRLTVDPKIAERWGDIVKQYEDEAAAFEALVNAWAHKTPVDPVVGVVEPPKSEPTPLEVSGDPVVFSVDRDLDDVPDDQILHVDPTT